MQIDGALILELKPEPLGFLVTAPPSAQTEKYFVALSPEAAGSLALALALAVRAEVGAEAGRLFAQGAA